jgi:hypothetical protein
VRAGWNTITIGRRFAGWVLLLWGLAWAGLATAQISNPSLEIARPDVAHGWVHLTSPLQSNAVLTLEAASDLRGWQPIGTFHDALWNYPVADTLTLEQRFFRLRAGQRGVNDDWKNQILYPVEPFCPGTTNQDIAWVKFAILLKDPTRVYFQDSRKFLFHYDFATQRLAPFQNMDRAGFDAISLHRANQQVVLGAVLYPPGTGYYSPVTPFLEYGVQFSGLDAYTPAEIAAWYGLVTSAVHAANAAQPFYIPSFEQSDAVRTNAEAFAAFGIRIGSIESWVTVTSCYSPGWALGRLKYFPVAEITPAYAEGRLLTEDILLTDGVPADMPPLSGIISLAPATPNSHTAILARSFGIPFVYLLDAAERARVQALAGHKVILYAWVDMGVMRVSVIDVEGLLDPAFEAELLALKAPEPIQYQPKQHCGSIWASTDSLSPASIRFFGGKAANYGLLRRSVPGNCPTAIAFSFDLWDAFLDQVLPGGASLRETIATRMAPFTNYPPDIVSLSTNLAAIRDLFTTTATFSGAQQQQITNLLLSHFNPGRKIRFRSSTNVEDSEHFTGAGLYDSYSGCLLDDLDGDTSGPSQCDPQEPKERGVFRALQKVYASFYNDDAVLERLAHRVDENNVGMAVLVHYSFPDEDELANGVATPLFTFLPGATNLSGDFVTQLGAVSVTNPDGSSIPEVLSVSGPITNLSFALKQRSSLVPLGGYVIDWPLDYQEFLRLFLKIGGSFRQFYPAKSNFCLDFEYKKDAHLGLVVKQVREIPQAAGSGTTKTAFLIDIPVTLSIAQTEGNGVCACHRLKSIWNLHTASMRLVASNLVNGIYTHGTFDYVEQGTLQRLTGPLDSWPNASHSPSGNVNFWTTGSGPSRRNWRLETSVMTNVPTDRPPFLTQADFPKRLTVTYANPVPILHSGGSPGTITNETAELELCPLVTADAELQERTFTNSNVTIHTRFYWPKMPGGIIIIWTAPLLQFVETRITGLTTNPIVLTSYFSQTYHPLHHNFGEECIFEPWLEPGIPAATLAELEAANIQWIYVYRNFNGSTFWALGRDQVLRRL